jgi:hypothetical protein
MSIADPIARFAALKNCPVCQAPVTPEEAACARCGMLVHRPSHTTFPMSVKWFALWEYQPRDPLARLGERGGVLARPGVRHRARRPRGLRAPQPVRPLDVGADRAVPAPRHPVGCGVASHERPVYPRAIPCPEVRLTARYPLCPHPKASKRHDVARGPPTRSALAQAVRRATAQAAAEGHRTRVTNPVIAETIEQDRRRQRQPARADQALHARRRLGSGGAEEGEGSEGPAPAGSPA